MLIPHIDCVGVLFLDLPPAPPSPPSLSPPSITINLSHIVWHDPSTSTPLTHTQLISLNSLNSSPSPPGAESRAVNQSGTNFISVLRFHTHLILPSHKLQSYISSHTPHLISYTHQHASLLIPAYHTIRRTILHFYKQSLTCEVVRSFNG